MATFVKGDYVQVCPQLDWQWDQWGSQHTKLCDKICSVVDVKLEQWTNQLFVEVEHRNERVWFLDRHLIKVKNYNEIFSEAIHEAAYKLNETERLSKKLRDEILTEVFTPEDERNKCSPKEQKDIEEELDNIFDDWEEVTTKEVIPLPGNGGTMTTPKDPKASANAKRKKIRKIKSFGNKKVKKRKIRSPGSLSSDWSLSEEEMKELQDYVDSLPYTPPNTSGDFEIDYDWDEDWEKNGNAD
jgi:hypothetical protein